MDSPVKITDAVGSLPSGIPAIDQNAAGWAFGEDNEIDIWWEVPSVWESFTRVQTQLWKSEAPFARRLWDFDLKFVLRIRRQGVIMPLVYVQAEAVDPDNLPGSRKYAVTTSGSYLHHEKDGKVEKLAPVALKSKFDPEIRLQLKLNDKLFRWMAVETDFSFELICTRGYGHSRISESIITNKSTVEV